MLAGVVHAVEIYPVSLVLMGYKVWGSSSYPGSLKYSSLKLDLRARLEGQVMRAGRSAGQFVLRRYTTYTQI